MHHTSTSPSLPQRLAAIHARNRAKRARRAFRASLRANAGDLVTIACLLTLIVALCAAMPAIFSRHHAPNVHVPGTVIPVLAVRG